MSPDGWEHDDDSESQDTYLLTDRDLAIIATATQLLEKVFRSPILRPSDAVSIVQSSSAEQFSPGGAAHDSRDIYPTRGRRDGGRKLYWTEPLPRRCAMGIEWQAVLARE